MTTAERETIKIGGWEGRPSNIGDGYDLYDSRREYRGYCPASMIVEHLKEQSGENYRALPSIKRNEIKTVTQPRQRGFAGAWTEQVFYYKGETLLGQIQTRRRYFGRIGHRMEILSCAKNSCIQGSSLAFICEQNGLRLERE